MKRIAMVLSVLMLASPVFAGGLPKEQVAAGAKWVFHLDVQGLVNSQTGQWLVKQISAQGHDAKLKEFTEKFGFDLLKDLKEITAYGLEHGEENGIAVLRANFNKDKVLEVLAANEGHKESKYGEITVHQWTEKKADAPVTTKYGCFYGDDLAVVAGSMDLLKTAIDVLDKKKDSLGKDDALAAMVKPAAGCFVLLAADQVVVPEKAPPKAAMLKKVQSLAAEAGEVDGKLYCKVALVAKTAKDGEAVRKIVEGLLAVAALMGDQVERKDTIQAEVIQMLQAIQVSGKDEAVSLEGAWDVQKLTALLERLEAAKKQGVPKVDIELKK